MAETKQLQVTEKQAVTPAQGEPTRAGLMWVPSVDIHENGDAITLVADLPGARREDVTIDVTDGVLTLSAQVAHPAANWRPLYREYEQGGFTRRFTLGERLDPAKITATMKDGVLSLVLPKAEAHKPRKISIK
jgi:HSP20 family protein